MNRISPALTPEEWAESEYHGTYGNHSVRFHVDHKGRIFAATRPTDSKPPSDALVILPSSACLPVAALALYGQPFGFTREDVEALTVLAVELEHLAEWRPDGMMLGPIDVMTANHHRDKAIGLRNLADRIAALLPPETPA